MTDQALDDARLTDEQILKTMDPWASEEKFRNEVLSIWRPRFDAATTQAWHSRDEEIGQYIDWVASLEARLEMPITIHGDYVLRAEAIEAAAGLVVVNNLVQGMKAYLMFGKIHADWMQKEMLEKFGVKEFQEMAFQAYKYGELAETVWNKFLESGAGDHSAIEEETKQ